MTSREIAELTGKMHKDVLYDIRTTLEQLGFKAADFSAALLDPRTGQSGPVFSLPKDLTITLVSGYSVPMRHRIVTRGMELETQHHGRGQTPSVGSSGYLPSGALLRCL
jgi:phage regulator Rha-like protein